MSVYSHCADFSKYYGKWHKCEWNPLECGVVNILKIHDGYEKVTESMQKTGARKFVVLISNTKTYNLPLNEVSFHHLHSVTKVKIE